MKREPLWRRYDRFFGANRRKDAADEIAFHYEMRVQDYVRRGMAEDAARAAAGERMGDIERTQAACDTLADAQTRNADRREWISELVQDTRYGVRTLVRSPSFTIVAVLTLALAMGATTTIFSVVNRVLIAPLPYADAGQLVRMYERAPDGRDNENPVSSGNYLDWRTQAKSFTAIGAFSGATGVSLTDDGDPIRITSAALTPSTLSLLGVRPLLGRLFTDDDANAGTFVVLGEGFWRSHFGGDSAVLSKTMRINTVSYQVIGVLPDKIDFPSAGIAVWRPIRNAGLDPEQRRSHNYGVIARLRPGTTIEQAQSEMTGIANALAGQYPEFMKGWGVNVENLRSHLVADSRTLLLILIGAASGVLLIACSNLANLLLARAVAREREFVLRGALGARRSRLVRQLLTESMLLAVAGGVLGLIVAGASLSTLLSLAPTLPFSTHVRVDGAVVAFAVALTVVSTIVFGLAPALRLSRGDLQTTLRTASGAVSSRGDARLRSTLLVTQIAMSVTLLVGAGLLVRSFAKLQSVDVGYRMDDVAMVGLDLPYARYQGLVPQQDFYASLIERVAQMPAVRGVAATTTAPARTPQTFSYTIEGRTPTNPSGREDPIPMHFVMGDYFGTLAIPLMRGRAFDASDIAGAPLVAVVNESFAKLYWASEDPLGKHLRRGSEGPWADVVGVVADARMDGFASRATPLVYFPYQQRTLTWLSAMQVLIRTDAGVDMASMIPSVRAAVRDIDPLLPLQEVTTVKALYRERLDTRSFAMLLVTLFGGLALVLSVIGLYGLASYGVAQQRREIGVRIALGASQQDIIGGVVGHSVKLVCIGVTIGLAGAAGLTRLLASLLYEVSPLDPITFGATALVVVAVAIIATCIPAVRAAAIPPLTALQRAN